MYILSFDRNFCEGIKGIMVSGGRQMTALAKLTETVEHAYKKRSETENKYLEALPEIGSCNEVRPCSKRRKTLCNFVLQY
jgi:hypothetical protein